MCPAAVGVGAMCEDAGHKLIAVGRHREVRLRDPRRRQSTPRTAFDDM